MFSVRIVDDSKLGYVEQMRLEVVNQVEEDLVPECVCVNL